MAVKTDRISKITQNYYENTLKMHGNNFRGMNWSSSKSQYLRFEQLCKIGVLKNNTLHYLILFRYPFGATETNNFSFIL